MPLETALSPVVSGEDSVDAEDSDAMHFQREWRRFERQYKRRRAFLERDDQQARKASNRLFIVSRNEDPWETFGLTTRLEYRRRVFEWSGLHFSELHDACASGDKTRVRRLLSASDSEQGETVNTVLARDSSGRTPLHQAVIREHHGVIRILLRHSDARLQLHVKDNRGAPPVQYVLEKMYHLAQKESGGGSVAVRSSRLLVSSRRVQRLWQLADRILHSMNPGLLEDMKSLDFQTRGDAWDAVRAGSVARLKTIHEVYGNESVGVLPELQFTLLHEVCSGPQLDLPVLLYLISERQLYRTIASQCGSTPLHCAASRGWLEACVLLLDEDVPGTDVDPESLLLATDARGRTPLHACLSGLGRKAINHGFGGRSDVLMTARYLAQRCPQTLQVVDYDGFTPLLYAIRSEDHSLVDTMISLGASLFHSVKCVLTKGEYGLRAPWAPCGLLLDKRQRYSTTVCLRTDGNSPTPKQARSGAASIACERMHHVKAGHVEHPGEAIPMETLWFLVGKRPTKHDQLQPATTVVEKPSIARRSVMTEVNTDAQDPLDSGRYGCRRFGAICDGCRLDTPIADEADTARSTIDAREGAVAMSPLVLAIRCCRLCVEANKCPNERVRVVETLLLAGGVVDDSAIDEALRAIESPDLLQLVLLHSGRHITREHLHRHFFSSPDETVRSGTDPRQSMLLLLLDTHPELFDSSLLPSLFRWRYFAVAEQMLEASNHQPHVMLEEGLLPRGPHRSCRPPALEVCHLDQLLRWKLTWPDRAGKFTALAWRCIHDLLGRPIIGNSHRRHQEDLAMSAAILELTADRETFLAICADKIADLMAKVFENGLVATAKQLWSAIAQVPEMVVALLCSMAWPIRTLDVYGVFLETFAQDLVQATLAMGEKESLPGRVYSTCFVMACMHKTPVETVQQIVTRMKRGEDASLVVEWLVTTHFGGLTLTQWILRDNRTDIAEMLLSEFAMDPDVGEQLWRAFTLASLASPAPNEQWTTLLFSTQPTASRRSWLSTRLARARQESPLLPPAVSWLTASSNSTDERDLDWLEDSILIQQMARWNALGVMQQLSSYLASEATSVLSKGVVKRDEADACTPIELCELLGHRELAKRMRSLATTSDSVPTTHNEANSEEPLRHSPFGLARSLLSLPSMEPSQYWRSAKAGKIDPRDVLTGNWKAAVVLNDIRVLETFDQHSVPMAPKDSNEEATEALVELMKTAIAHGSEDTLEWLVTKKTSGIVLPASHTTELLHLAARHTSVLYADMTLLLLLQPGFDPGRLDGDGTDVTLLHRAACFSDTTLAASIFQLLLAKESSDVNVRDGFGFTPIAYALAAGNLATACFLLDHYASVRLEAEFEGQSAFYYTLQLLPSFAWRWIVRTLLTTKRHAAFLHCVDDGCACKGFERTTGDATYATLECSFCGHAGDVHTRVPFPPWFRDQYETYCAPQRAGDDSDGGEDDVDVDVNDDDEEAASRRRLRALLDAPLVDEASLERDCGRLRTRALEHLTRLRFQTLLTAHALALPSAGADDPNGEDEDEEAERERGRGEEQAAGRRQDMTAAASVAAGDSHANLAAASGDAAPSSGLLARPSCDAATAVAHGSAHGSGGSMGFPTTRDEQIHTVLVRWLRTTAAAAAARGPQSDRTPGTTVDAVFARWRDVTMAATSTWVSFHGVGDAPVASDISGSVPRPPMPTAEAHREVCSSVRSSFSSSSPPSSLAETNVTASTSTSPTAAIGCQQANKSLSLLHLFVFHWRYARVYQCFRLWRRRCANVNAQVALQEHETLAETWAAETRRARLQALLARQRALERSIQGGG